MRVRVKVQANVFVKVRERERVIKRVRVRLKGRVTVGREGKGLGRGDHIAVLFHNSSSGSQSFTIFVWSPGLCKNGWRSLIHGVQ